MTQIAAKAAPRFGTIRGANDRIPPLLDERHSYRGSSLIPAICRIRIYAPAGKPPVILCTELPENHGTSITNCAEHLAAEVIRQYFTQRFDDPDGEVWIEHYPGERGIDHGQPTYDRVTFQHTAPRMAHRSGAWRLTLGEPTWHRLSVAEVLALLQP
jgi:hypothetical protein